MEKVLQVFTGMVSGGFTWAGIGQLMLYFMAAIALLALYKSGNRIVASIFIRRNFRLNPGETWLGLQDNGGGPFTGKFLKCGWVKVYILHCGTGGLLEFSTNAFNDAVKHYLPCKPDSKVNHPDKTASDFGL